MKKIKILNDSQKSSKTFQDEINKFLSNGWKIKGNLFKYEKSLHVTLIKKTVK